MTEQEERRRAWAKPERFIEERTRPATHTDEWTRVACLDAWYRIWAYFREEAAISRSVFEIKLADLMKKRKHDPIVVSGQVCYPLWLLDWDKKLEEAPDNKDKTATKPLGRVKVKRELRFVDCVLTRGVELDWLAMTEHERRELDGKKFLVVRHLDKRRWIPADAVKRVL